MREITALLQAAGKGQDEALGQLLPLLYGELRRLARSRMRRMGALTLLDTTGLVHEAYLRMQGAQGLAFPDRHHFLAYAARVMRALAVDAARGRKALKRGAGAAFVTLEIDTGVAAPCMPDNVLRVNEALDELAQVDPRLANVVELRFFGGLTEAEIAEHLQLTERTVQRDWRKARLFLLAALAD
jgi:RNA polymerase sigma factor (TIGR02999 family)